MLLHCSVCLLTGVGMAGMYSYLPPVFKPGEEGVYWYAVISGGLEMLDVDPLILLRFLTLFVAKTLLHVITIIASFM